MRGKFLSGPAGLLILILFFLPWVTVSCDGDDLGDLTGYQLTLGDDDIDSDEFEADPLLLVIPLTALAAVVISIALFISPSLSRITGGILLFLSMVAIVIPLLRGIMLQNEYSNAVYEILLRPALWGTMVGLLGIFTSGLIDLVRTPAQPAIRGKRRRKKDDLLNQWQAQPQEGSSHTMVDADLFQAPGGLRSPGNETMIDDDVFSSGGAKPTNTGPAYGNETIMDDDLVLGRRPGTGGNETILDDDLLEGRPRPPVQATTPYQDFNQGGTPPRTPDKTEVLPPQPDIVASVVFLNGPRKNDHIRLSPLSRIGRVPGNEIVLDDTAVSTHHATIKLANGSYYIRDENSTNGLYIFIEQENRWEQMQQTRLEDGSKIKIGRIVLQLRIQQRFT